MTRSFRDRIERWFETMAAFFYTHRVKTLLAIHFVAGGTAWHLPDIKIDVSTEGFLHEEDPFLMDYNAFRDQFGRDELILVGVRSDNIFSLPFLRRLKELHEAIEDNVPYIEDITSLVNARNTRGEGDRLIVEDLLEEWPANRKDLAILKKRVFANPLYRNLLISEDGRFTAIVVKTQTYSSADSQEDVLGGFEDFAAGAQEAMHPGI